MQIDPEYNPESILDKSIAGRYQPVRVADGLIPARCRFIKNASWELLSLFGPIVKSAGGTVYKCM